MNNDIKANTDAIIEWLEQLAADNYNQCSGKMNSADELIADPQKHDFCCLGVAREVLRQYEDDVVPSSAPQDDDAYNVPTYDEERALGLRDPYLFTELNDSCSLTFPEIAQQAIAYPERFFTEEAAEAIKEHFYES